MLWTMNGFDATCERCVDLRQVVRIGNERRLQMAHRVVLGNIADNTIYQVESPSKGKRVSMVKTLFGVDHDPDPVMPEFENLLSVDYLPDSILYYFRCSGCKLLFEFSVNTYHGSGGEWRPVVDEDLV